MEVKKLFVGPIKSKENCKYFNIINWILVVLLASLFIPMMFILFMGSTQFKSKYVKERLGVVIIGLILQVFLACSIFIVRIMHGICLKSLK